MLTDFVYPLEITINDILFGNALVYLIISQIPVTYLINTCHALSKWDI